MASVPLSLSFLQDLDGITYVNATQTAISTVTGALRVVGGIGTGDGIFAGGKIGSSASTSASSNQGALYYGTLSYNDTNNLLTLQSSANTYVQLVVQNTNAGASASSDVTISNDQGASNSFYGNFGMNSSGFSGSGSFNLPNAVYVASSNGDLVLGSFSNNSIRFVLNSGSSDAVTISTVTNDLVVNFTTSATSTTTGALRVIGGVGVGGNIYVGGKLFGELAKITVGTVAPTSPSVNDVWIDTN